MSDDHKDSPPKNGPSLEELLGRLKHVGQNDWKDLWFHLKNVFKCL